jgi:ribosomal-protein-alanine N-acetyltransferase
MNVYQFTVNQGDQRHIYSHLLRCDNLFVPPLSTRVNVEAYATKLALSAERFEAWHTNELICLVAAYMNDPATKKAFITNVSTEASHQGLGIAGQLLSACIDHATKRGYNSIELEVAEHNRAAVHLYHKWGFSVLGKTTPGFCKFARQLQDK